MTSPSPAELLWLVLWTDGAWPIALSVLVAVGAVAFMLGRFSKRRSR